VTKPDPDISVESSAIRQSFAFSESQRKMFSWAFVGQVGMAFLAGYFHFTLIALALVVTAVVTWILGVFATIEHRRIFLNYWESTGLSNLEAKEKYSKDHPPALD
jgi:hypothetical protein